MRLTILAFLAAFVVASMAQQPAAPPKTAPQKKAEEPAKAAPKPPPGPPSERRQSNYIYDANGRPLPAEPAVREQHRQKGSQEVVERRESLQDFHGKPVTVRTSEERVVTQKEGERAGERVIQRYDPNGKPTRKALLKFERRKMPDGSTVSTEVLYEQDVNGRMQFVERRTTTEKETGSGMNGATLVERPSVDGRTQVVERVDRTETKRGEAVIESVSSRKLLDANGRFAERERQTSVSTKSDNQTTTETKQWEAGPTGQMDFVSRSLSRVTAVAGGNEVEDTEVYATKIAGITPDLNRPQVPTLEQKVRREKKVQADGKIVETTSAQVRHVADPSRLGGLVVTEQVTTPTPDGRTIQRTVSERDPNGKMVRVRSEVEEEKK